MRETRRIFGIIIFSILCIVLIGSGCSSKANPSTGGGDSSQLLKNVYNDGVFVFGDLPWLTTKQEVMKQKQLDDSNSEKGDVLKAEESFSFNNSSLKKIVIYRFSDDKFVSGEYLFSTTDNKLFAQFCEELKTNLSKTLPKPNANDLNILDGAGDASAQGKNVSWEGKDHSTLTVNLLTAEQGKDTEYLLQIKSSSPLPERQGLKP
ncbi:MULTISPECIES: hypothetical protein [Paenibacillus]|uniref:Lipoprotein n=1 Tax=Paenibacillus albilobatus TaxID=2716884 RepID=A0A920CCJ4_9BACL|nr:MULTISPECIES: hypothetical protein [Paenibacillus]GIO31677.1 hypothetical protein J2TS6_28180 [Paenibacillus albilobatus]